MLFKKDEKRSQPHPDWPWAINEGGVVRRDPAWEDIERGLKALCLDTDSFIILEQSDPSNKKNYWFVQSAIAKMGPKKGMYIVEAGWNGRSGPMPVERAYHWDALEEEVTDIFERAYQRKPLDLTGFEKCDLRPGG